MDNNERLSRLTIATPCPMDWDRMSGDDRVRYCTACGQHVQDFAKMTAADASSLLRDNDSDVCGRLSRLPDGTLMTADHPVAAASTSRPWQYRIRSLMGVIAGVAAILGISRLFAEDPSKPPRTTKPVPLIRPYMGKVALRPARSPQAPAISSPSSSSSACPVPQQ
jgi:hypothetical protein